jgi:septal ring factor EnvC (AmiA/AmiB activator)
VSSSLRRREKSRPSARLTPPGKERSTTAAKGGKLPSFMALIINRCALVVVISLSALLLGGCTGVFEQDPREQANDAIAQANESIAEHNKLFEEARDTYADVKEEIESGEDPSEEDRNRITEAKDTLEEARANLDDARESLATVQNLDVDKTVKEYADLLLQAMDAQLAAEAKEVEFYDLLEEDPALENNREKAMDLLSEIGAGYEEAEKAYSKAQDLANSSPNVIEAAPEGGENNPDNG